MRQPDPLRHDKRRIALVETYCSLCSLDMTDLKNEEGTDCYKCYRGAVERGSINFPIIRKYRIKNGENDE